MIVDISAIEVAAIRYAIDGLSDPIGGGSERNAAMISDLQRYEPSCHLGDEFDGWMKGRSEGGWVSYDDHIRELGRVRFELNAYKIIVSQLKEQLKEAGIE